MVDLFELKVAGKVYSGWTSLQVTRSIEQLAHSFSVELTDRWAADMAQVPVAAGQPCVVELNGTKVLSGYIDTDNLSYDATSRTLSIAGRSKTGDLIDCAAVYKSGGWKKQDLLKIAKDLCFYFGISASAKVSVGSVFNWFALEPGETAFQAIERGARMRGLLMLTDSAGNLVLDRVGTSKVKTTIERGVNVLRGGKSNNWTERFATYIIKTQSRGTNTWNGSAASAITRESVDEGVTRNRATYISPDTEDNGSELQKRVDWERNVRAGRSKRWFYTVPGWTHDGGLWEPNTRVRVKDTDLMLDGELLIVSATFKRSEQGTTTDLELTIPEAFDVQPLPPARAKASKKTNPWSGGPSTEEPVE